MALKALMLRKKIDTRKKLLESLNEKDSDFSVRRAELETAITEAEKDEELDAVNEEIEKLEAEEAANKSEKDKVEGEIAELEKSLAEVEEEQAVEPETEQRSEEVTPVTPEANGHVERSVDFTMDKRDVFKGMDIQTRNAMFEREDVKAWLGEVRTAIKEKRAINNVGLTIPQVLLGVLRQNIENYSKLIGKVMLRSVSGTARMIVGGNLPEAVWTECCANLNELDLSFTDVEVDCYKVGKKYLLA